MKKQESDSRVFIVTSVSLCLVLSFSYLLSTLSSDRCMEIEDWMAFL